ncbi:MAG TPA: acyltransferase domain-containing protein [Acidimicrobiales bacterium]
MLVFTFPGQGSQRAEMGRPWVDHPSWGVVEEASEAAGRDLAQLLLRAPIETLTETANAQMCTFVLSLVVLDAVERLGLSPGACAGHSLGEYTALVAAGAVTFGDGVELVAARGEAMSRATADAPGTMAALMGLGDDDAELACQRADGEVWVANYNGTGQVIIAGRPAAVEAAAAIARELGARKVVPLPVAGAFHTPLMGGAQPALRKALDEVSFVPSEVPVVANVDALAHRDPAEWPTLLAAQLCRPVRWHQSLGTLVDLGAQALVELGPGGVLSGLAKRGAPGARALSVAAPEDLDALMDAVTELELVSARPRRHRSPVGGGRNYLSDRLVVSPAAGSFRPAGSLAATEVGFDGPGRRALDVGEVVGFVGALEVRTPFSGHIVRWFVGEGDAVRDGQPVLRLRATEAADG